MTSRLRQGAVITGARATPDTMRPISTVTQIHLDAVLALTEICIILTNDKAVLSFKG